MNEKDFVNKITIPLLKTLGFNHVRYVCGQDEYGRDITFYDFDKFGIERLFCAQAKKGDISGNSESCINKIISQIDDAFTMPYHDRLRNEEKYIAGMYIIISGKYKINAKNKIQIKTKGRPVYFLDKTDLENIDLKLIKAKDKFKKEQLKNIRTEILAESRCKDINFHYIERKLNELDLLENYLTIDKIEVLSELGLEMTLNTLKGTELLVEHLLWYLNVEYFSKKIYTNLLESIITILWGWGIQTVEYQRNKESVKIILNALKQINERIKNLNNLKLTELLNKVIGNMIYQAKIDKLDNIRLFIENEIKNLIL